MPERREASSWPILMASMDFESDKPPKRTQSAAAIAEAVVEDADENAIDDYLESMGQDTQAADRAARVLEQIARQKPALLAPYIKRLVPLLYSGRDRVANACGIALFELTQVAPAKVAKQLGVFRERFDSASDAARNGTMHIFVGLCRASVTYQRRLQDVLERAVIEVSPQWLLPWAEQLLPTLKGEPYAEVRAHIAARLSELPMPQAQKLANVLGFSKRPLA